MSRMPGMVPAEIVAFMQQCFQIVEARGRVGTAKSVVFEVRTRETNHHTPHIHASYDKYSISIAIEDGKVLAGNLPKRQEKDAVNWVKEHREYLLGKWKDLAISAESSFTQSALDFSD